MKSVDIMTKVLQPFPGLRPFQKSESDVFFGRGEQIDALLATLEDNNVVAVVGASGSGKSSLVRAGLLPALEAGFLSGAGPDWRMVLMRPGKAPFSQLAKALLEAADAEQADDPQLIAFTEATLRSGPRGLLEAIQDLAFPPGTNVLLLIDQFEEIFRFRHRKRVGADASSQTATTAERNDATAFINMLLATKAENDLSLYAVITMRSDFLGDCDAFHGLPEAINACQFLVPRLRRDQLRETITLPLDLFGATADQGLVNRMLNEIGTDPDQLPLMQHLLARMWSQARKRSGDEDVVLRSSDYEAVGGLENALSMHADEAYAGLDDDQSKRVAELMFRCLCDLGSEARLTRRLVTVAEVAAVAGVDADKVEEVADVFLDIERSFLMKSPPGDMMPATTLDISHESLIRQWSRMAEWVSDESQSSSKYRRLSETACLWKGGHASLLVSPELDIALDWREREKPTKAWADRYGGGFDLSMEFLDASVVEQSAQASRQRRDTRRKTAFLLSTIAIVSVLMLIAVVLWLLAQAQSALLNNRWIDSQMALGTASIRDGRMSEGLLRYSAAYRKTTSGQPANESARNLIAAWSDLAGRPLVHDNPVRKMALGLDGQTILTVTEQGARLWSLKTGEPIGKRLAAESDEWQAVAVSPDATKLIVATGESARIWDVRSATPLGQSCPHGERISFVTFSADGSTVLTAGSDRVQLWDARTGTRRETPGQVPRGANIALSPDGQRVLIGGNGTTLVDWESGESTMIPTESKGAVSFSPDGLSVITAGASVQVWDTKNHSPRGAPLSHLRVKTVAFSPFGKLVLTGSEDNTARIWETQTGDQRGLPLRHVGTVVAATFSPDGKSVLTGSADNSARLWDVATGRPLSQPLRHAGTVDSVAFSRDGRTLLTGSVDGSVRLWQVRKRRSLSHDIGVAAISPDGQTLVLGNQMGTELFNIRTGNRESVSVGETTQVAAFSPDGSMILTASGSVLQVWDARTRKQLPSEFPLVEVIVAATFGPESKTILTASGRTAQLWDLENPANPKQVFRHKHAVLAAAISPDGSRVVTGSADNTGQLWNVQTGESIGTGLEHGDDVLAVAFSPDGRLVATGGADNIAAFWDVQTASHKGTPLPHQDAVRAVTFSPDGNSLLTASNDTSARLWDVASCELRGDPLLHSDQVHTALFQRSGSEVLTVADDASAWYWHVVPPATDEPERLRLSIEWRSGFYLSDEGQLRPLKHDEWLELKHQLDELGGPCDVQTRGELSPVETDEVDGKKQ